MPETEHSIEEPSGEHYRFAEQLVDREGGKLTPRLRNIVIDEVAKQHQVFESVHNKRLSLQIDEGLALVGEEA